MRSFVLLCFPIALLLSLVCGGQTRPQFNTASAGVKASDIESAVSLICQAKDIKRGRDGAVEGCLTCPQGTDFHGTAGNAWEIYAQTPGHFTSPQANDLILDGTGCDSHANNFGGSFVFTINGGKARLLHYNPGLITDQCHKFAYADGRHHLICRGGWGGQGESDPYVFEASFHAGGIGTSSRLVALRDTTGTCGDDATTVVRESEIKDVRFTPAASEKITGLTVVATFGTVRCSRIAASTKPKTAKPQPAAKTYEITFSFDGKRFRPTPESQAVLNHIEPH